MKRLWAIMVLSVLFLGLTVWTIICAISGRFQLSPGDAIGFVFGLFVLAVILVVLLKK
jgi:hypothetical protein